MAPLAVERGRLDALEEPEHDRRRQRLRDRPPIVDRATHDAPDALEVLLDTRGVRQRGPRRILRRQRARANRTPWRRKRSGRSSSSWSKNFAYISFVKPPSSMPASFPFSL